MNESLIPERRFRRLLTAGLLWPAVLILLFCLALVYQGIVAGYYRDAFMASQLQDTKGRELRTELLDMETGIRGYLLTDDPEYFTPFELASKRLNADLDAFVQASADDAQTHLLARRISKDALAWRDTALANKEEKSAGKPMEPKLLARSKQQFDGLRMDFKAYFDMNTLTMRRSETGWFTQRKRVVWTLIFGAVLIAAALAVIVLLLLRRLSKMYHAALVAYDASAQQITELNTDLEQRVKDRTTELTRANHELEAFSYSVSHDLRAPLRSIASFSAILQQDIGEKLDDESNDNLRRIRAAAAKMGTLIDALLSFSRIARTALNRARVDITQIAESILSDLARDTLRKAETTVQPGLVADADPHLLRVVLENLLENAWKFSAKATPSKIEVGMVGGAFCVRDNGVGFDQKYVDKIFLPFERLHTDQDFPGTGIGLATTMRIIERHGGEIWAESIKDGGTTFYFTLGPDEDSHNETSI